MSRSSAAVEWWEEWQLRVLVLGSLFIQFFLYFSDMVRRSPTLGKLRVFVWLAYVGGDAVAIYALATLFNHHKQQTAGGVALQVIWAPLLLIHLGGQPWITAYSLEDNELWKRHAITLVSQVTVALYVFCKWWSGEKQLLQVAVTLFLVGIVKFAQKPWALKRASFISMQAYVDGRPLEKPGCIRFLCLLCTTSIKDICLILPKYTAERLSWFTQNQTRCLEEYVKEASKRILAQKEKSYDEVKSYSTPVSYIYQMFVDLTGSYNIRLQMLSVFLGLNDDTVYDALQRSMRFIFQLLYTKVGITITLVGILQLIVFPFLILACLVVFTVSHKDDYNDNDVRVTYILLCCTAMLELLLTLSFLCAPCRKAYSAGWHNMVSQYNLMSFYARKKRPTILMKLATFNCLRDYLNKNWYNWQEPAARQITMLVRQHVKYGWKNYIRGDIGRYRRFNDLRGQWTLRRHHQLRWSLRMPFDESVIVWHIATDLYFYHPNTSPQVQGDANPRGTARVISNYMIYLLSTRPEMLMPGTRSAVFTNTISCIDRILEYTGAPLDNEENIARSIIRRAMKQLPDDTYVFMRAPSPSLVDKAGIMVTTLMELGERERWTVIQGVWVEMLCYSASRCRGYLHAKSLGEGGEYLTTVWLHWSLMGMETLADRLQRPEPPLEEEEAPPAETSAAEEDAAPESTTQPRSRADISIEIIPV